MDTHVHVWDTRRPHYPWLEQHTELARVVHPIDADPEAPAVFVQADCVPEQRLAEVRHVEGLGWPQLAGIVAFAPLESATAAEPVLDELARHARVVGVRRLLQGEPEGFIADSGFTAGLAAAHRTVPDAVVVLDHLGNPPLDEGLDSAAGKA